MNDTFFKRNRLALTESVKNGLVVVTAYDAMQSSNDASYEYVQEANFWWLTGIEDSGWQVVIDGVRGRTTLVAPNKSEISRIFEGGLSDQDAIGLSGADDVIHADEYEVWRANTL